MVVSSNAETERSLRSRLAAFCRGASSHTAEGGGFGILPSVTCSRSCGINPAPRHDPGWGAKHAGVFNIAIIFLAGQCHDSAVRSEGRILIPPLERSLQAAAA